MGGLTRTGWFEPVAVIHAVIHPLAYDKSTEWDYALRNSVQFGPLVPGVYCPIGNQPL